MDSGEAVEQFYEHGLTQEVQQAIEDNPHDFVDYMDEDEELAEIVMENL